MSWTESIDESIDIANIEKQLDIQQQQSDILECGCSSDYALYNPLCPSPKSEERNYLLEYKFDKFIYLDNNATHPILSSVKNEMLEVMNIVGNASSNHIAGQKIRILIEQSRENISDFIHCKDPRNIIFTSCGSESNNLFIKGVAFKNIQSHKKEIIISAFEHKSVLSTVKYLENMFGFKCIILPITIDGLIDTDILKSSINDNTLLVSIMAANNETGTILPIHEYVDIIKNINSSILIHSDMSQTLGKMNDVHVGNLDAATFTAHKFGGPTGVGVLYVKDFDVFDSNIHGGNQEFVKRAGTYSAHQIVGFGSAVKCLKDINIKELEMIKNYTENMLINQGIKINCKNSKRLSNTISAILPNTTAEFVVNKLSKSGIFISAGSACNSYEKVTSYVLKAINLNDNDAYNTIRISTNRFTSKNDIDIFISELTEILKGDKYE